jgi:hypothetical protein
VIVLTEAQGSPIALNPNFITAVVPRSEEDDARTKTRVYIADGDSLLPVLVREEYLSVVNQVSNALAFSIVSRESSD